MRMFTTILLVSLALLSSSSDSINLLYQSVVVIKGIAVVVLDAGLDILKLVSSHEFPNQLDVGEPVMPQIQL